MVAEEMEELGIKVPGSELLSRICQEQTFHQDFQSVQLNLILRIYNLTLRFSRLTKTSQ